jgi:phosphatidylinositol glycan class U
VKNRDEMEKKKKRGFWRWLIASVMLRLILIYLPKTFNLASRPEVSTPLVSLRRRKYSLSLSPSLSLFDLTA